MSMDEQAMQEMYRLTRENNKMLHSMRRNAFWGGLLKFIIYAALLTAPIWFYMTYLNNAVQQLLQTMNKIEGTSVQAQAQLNSYQQAWQQFESKLPGFMQAPTSTKP